MIVALYVQSFCMRLNANVRSMFALCSCSQNVQLLLSRYKKTSPIVSRGEVFRVRVTQMCLLSGCGLWFVERVGRFGNALKLRFTLEVQ